MLRLRIQHISGVRLMQSRMNPFHVMLKLYITAAVKRALIANKLYGMIKKRKIEIDKEI